MGSVVETLEESVSERRENERAVIARRLLDGGGGVILSREGPATGGD